MGQGASCGTGVVVGGERGLGRLEQVLGSVGSSVGCGKVWGLSRGSQLGSLGMGWGLVSRP